MGVFRAYQRLKHEAGAGGLWCVYKKTRALMVPTDRPCDGYLSSSSRTSHCQKNARFQFCMDAEAGYDTFARITAPLAPPPCHVFTHSD